EFKLLYVGKFNKGKNIIALQNAVISINKSKAHKVTLHLVGGGGNREKQVLDIAKKNPKYFRVHGVIGDKKALQNIYKYCHVFTMPSRKETFGLVYIEALLQGLPILFTRDEGIDGL